MRKSALAVVVLLGGCVGGGIDMDLPVGEIERRWGELLPAVVAADTNGDGVINRNTMEWTVLATTVPPILIRWATEFAARAAAANEKK